MENSLPFGSVVLAARRAADVVAALHPPSRLAYRETVCNVNDVLARYSEIDTVTEVEFDDLKLVTQKIYKIFTVLDTGKTAMLLNNVLAEYASTPCLRRGKNKAWQVCVDDGEGASWVERFAAASALAFAVLLAEKGWNACKLCASSSCHRPYVDVSRDGSKNYCSPRCATRERVAAYRKRTV